MQQSRTITNAHPIVHLGRDELSTLRCYGRAFGSNRRPVFVSAGRWRTEHLQEEKMRISTWRMRKACGNVVGVARYFEVSHMMMNGWGRGRFAVRLRLR